MSQCVSHEASLYIYNQCNNSITAACNVESSNISNNNSAYSNDEIISNSSTSSNNTLASIISKARGLRITPSYLPKVLVDLPEQGIPDINILDLKGRKDLKMCV